MKGSKIGKKDRWDRRPLEGKGREGDAILIIKKEQRNLGG